ncbi:MAG: DUF3592 domain-containing protein [Terracidiphilus sp.]
MLIELLEKWRGYDKWVEADARIKSSDLAPCGITDFSCGGRANVMPALEWQSNCVIVWKDLDCKEHSAEYAVWGNSPLFQLFEGQSVTIRYNPSNPDEYYLRGVMQSRLSTTFKLRVLPIVIAWILAGLLLAALVRLGLMAKTDI